MQLVLTSLASTIVVPGGLMVGLPYLILAAGSELDGLTIGARKLLGIAPIAIGVALLFSCTRGFIVHGDGTPNPLEPPRLLVARGPYRFVRNPMYVSMGLVVAGEAWLFGSVALLAYLFVIMLAFHAFVVGYEEPTLRKLFGVAYEHYCARVPRWMPRFGTRQA